MVFSPEASWQLVFSSLVILQFHIVTCMVMLLKHASLRIKRGKCLILHFTGRQVTAAVLITNDEPYFRASGCRANSSMLQSWLDLTIKESTCS